MRTRWTLGVLLTSLGSLALLASRPSSAQSPEFLSESGLRSLQTAQVQMRAAVQASRAESRARQNLTDMMMRDIREGYFKCVADESGGDECSEHVPYYDFLSLIEAGADVNARDGDGDTALMAAAARGEARVVKVLLKAGADANASGPQGKTPLMTAAAYPFDGVVSGNMVAELLKAGARVDDEDINGDTALIVAAQNVNAVSLGELINAGANVNIADKDGNTALVVAAETGAYPEVNRLLKAGALKPR